MDDDSIRQVVDFFTPEMDNVERNINFSKASASLPGREFFEGIFVFEFYSCFQVLYRNIIATIVEDFENEASSSSRSISNQVSKLI